MNSWVSFGYTSISWGIWLCCITVPLLGLAQLIFRHRLRAYWLLVCVALTLYATAVVSFTLLPLTGTVEPVCNKNPIRLTPFASFARAITATEGYTLPQTLLSSHVLQIFFNILLFVPLGFIARAVFKRRILTSTLIALGTSLAIEISQLTGFWGIHPCAYRIFETDDLITNTTGGLIGAVLAASWIALRTRPEKPLPWSKEKPDLTEPR